MVALALGTAWDTGRFLARNGGGLFVQALPAWSATVLVLARGDLPFPIPAAGAVILGGLALWLNVVLATAILGSDLDDRIGCGLGGLFRGSMREARVAAGLIAGGALAVLAGLAVTVAGTVLVVVGIGGLGLVTPFFVFPAAVAVSVAVVGPRVLPWCVAAARGDPAAFTTGARLGRNRSGALFLAMLPAMGAVAALVVGWRHLRDALAAGAFGLPALPGEVAGRLDTLAWGTLVVAGVVVHAVAAARMVHRLRGLPDP